VFQVVCRRLQLMIQHLLTNLISQRYQDYLDDNDMTSSKAYVLEGGIKAWLHKFGEDADLVDND
jgi:hypothetical protein